MYRKGSSYITIIIILMALTTMAVVIASVTFNGRMASAAFGRGTVIYNLARSGAEIATTYLNELIISKEIETLESSIYIDIKNNIELSGNFIYNIPSNGYQYSYEISYNIADDSTTRKEFIVETTFEINADSIAILTFARETEKNVGVKMRATLEYDSVTDVFVIKTLQQY